MSASVAVLLLAGCTNRQMKADDLRSEIKNASSLSRECELLLDMRTGGRITERFRQVHEHYLTKQIEELEKNVEKAQPEPHLQAVFTQYRSKLREFKAALNRIEPQPHRATFTAITHDLESLEQQL